MYVQHKQKQAALANARLEPATVSQEAALRGLVATAKGVKDPLKPTFLEPVARMGAGRFHPSVVYTVLGHSVYVVWTHRVL